jgi:hypothetical protein
VLTDIKFTCVSSPTLCRYLLTLARTIWLTEGNVSFFTYAPYATPSFQRSLNTARTFFFSRGVYGCVLNLQQLALHSCSLHACVPQDLTKLLIYYRLFFTGIVLVPNSKQQRTCNSNCNFVDSLFRKPAVRFRYAKL